MKRKKKDAESEEQAPKTQPSESPAPESPDLEPTAPEEKAAVVSRDDLAGSEDMDWEKRYLRLKADFDNYKRHVNAERERLSEQGKELILTDLFPLVEHMERAIQSSRSALEKRQAEDHSSPPSSLATAVLAGVDLLYRELLSLLEKHGVERVPTIGQTFDPNLHSAVAALPRSDVEENTILEEVRPGFRRQGKLLQPAAVVVAKTE